MRPRVWSTTLAVTGTFAALMSVAVVTSVPAALAPAVTAACLVGVLKCRPRARSRAIWAGIAPGLVSVFVTLLVLAGVHEPSTREGAYGMVEVALLCVLLAVAVRWLEGPKLWVIAGLTAIAQVAWILRFLPDRDIGPLVAGCAFWSIPSLVALVVGGYPRLAATRLRDSVAQARAEQRRELERDLHDYVAHDLTGMIVQAQAARFAAADDPQRLRNALRRIEESGQRAMTSMDRALQLLREDGGQNDASASRRPGLAALEELVDAFGRSDPTAVRLTTTGPLAQLPREVDETLYRVCVESLTNVRRHAPAALEVTVALVVESKLATLVVADRVPQQQSPGRGRRRGGGSGLHHARARVEALGGTLVAGPQGDGWRVTAAVPL